MSTHFKKKINQKQKKKKLSEKSYGFKSENNKIAATSDGFKFVFKLLVLQDKR